MNSPSKNIIRAITPRPVRNWLRSPNKSLGWMRNEARYLVGANRLIEIRPGWTLRCHPTAYDFAYYAQINDPEQVTEFDGFISVCRSGMMLFDIGAHFGLFSLATLHYGGLGARAVAVDPSPTAARMMKIQARLNGVVERIEIVQAAVGHQDGWQEMVATGVNGAGYFVPPEDHTGREVCRTRAITLDALVEEQKQTPTHVKIDVEGSEAAVLRGGSKLLSSDEPPILLLELHNEIIKNHSGDPCETLTLLRQFGYETFSSDMLPLSEDYILSKPLVRVICRKR